MVPASELRFFRPVINLTSSCWLFLISGKKNAVCSCWVETSILTAVSKNSLFSDLAQTAPMTGRALSSQHDSQPPGHTAKADLSFMVVLGLVLKWRLLKGQRKEKERNQLPGKAET